MVFLVPQCDNEVAKGTLLSLRNGTLLQLNYVHSLLGRADGHVPLMKVARP